ncbi:Probable diguanylate cyclase YcdT [Acholeplasma oculi]|uniref:GAF sensor-containing diguanylate cyclase n=1 Tax=Acholeplasma oculi TaxID=35623 RepID=A0A061AFG6_9MOLU|nr:diguanylate cyclase [Acholeplasma oculi]CDR30271.1 GAF sensor-containing diguanylate cyclase [Acholeplasma oculi]SKC43403.1 diguanylate cyclase (GGDEF) domain-containing protein [Acholeplasma oculi]SUT88697.1 Probable diguanylate cyclase YcdT [Acholeplasma oculi]
MKMNQQTVLAYKNFEKLSKNVMDLAKEIMPDKIIYINFLNDEVQVTMRVSKHDTKIKLIEGKTIPVHEAICNLIDYESGKPLIYEDIKSVDFDPLVQKTVDDLNIGSYVGIPISFKDGLRFGTLCAAHHDRQTFSKKEVKLLSQIAELFSYYLELENLAFKDTLTNLYNSNFLRNHHDKIVANGGLAILLDLDGFKNVNDSLGHLKGNEILKEVGNKILKEIDYFKDSYAARIGGDEFFIFIKEKLSENQIRLFLNDLIHSLNHYDTNINETIVTVSIGAYYYEVEQFINYKNLIEKIDTLMYQAKRLGKNKFVLNIEK